MAFIIAHDPKSLVLKRGVGSTLPVMGRTKKIDRQVRNTDPIPAMDRAGIRRTLKDLVDQIITDAKSGAHLKRPPEA